MGSKHLETGMLIIVISGVIRPLGDDIATKHTQGSEGIILHGIQASTLQASKVAGPPVRRPEEAR